MGSFHHTARNWRIRQENGATLFRVEVKDMNGNWIERTIRLDDHIGNTDGILPYSLHPGCLDIQYIDD